MTTTQSGGCPLVSRRHLLGGLAAAASAPAWLGRTPAFARTDPTDALCYRSLLQVADGVRAGSLSSVSLVTACLDRIGRYDQEIRSYITVLRDQALRDAAACDQERAAGKIRGPLHGVPIALKDNIQTAGIRTTSASRQLENFIPREDAEVVKRLRAAGAVILGKTNMSEFAFGGASYFGNPRNPWNLDRTTGGSSSGSAAATAAGLCFGSLGTDTACSIRIPSAHCGVVGIKPTYGLVPLLGVNPDSPYFAHCGPMARTVEDVALMLTVLAGYQNDDITSIEHEKEDYLAQARQSVSGLKVGIARVPFYDHLQPGVAAAMDEAIRVLRGLVASVGEISLPTYESLGVHAQSMMHAERFVFARGMYDRYPEEFLPRTHQILRDALEKLDNPPRGAAEGVADYIRGRNEIERIRRTGDSFFGDFDVAVLPTSRRVPGGKADREAQLRRIEQGFPETPGPGGCVENNTVFSLMGVPAVSVPCGFVDGIPVGLEIVGRKFSEGKLLAIANAYQRATDWTSQRPSFTAR